MWRTAVLGLWPAVVMPVLYYYLDHSRGTPYSIWAVVPIYHAFCVGLPLLFGKIRKPDEKPEPKPWILWTAVISAGFLAVGIFLPVLVASWEFPTMWVMGVKGFYSLRPLHDGDLIWVAFMVATIVVHPFIEEYYWRGFLFLRTGAFLGAVFYWLAHFTALKIYMDMGWFDAYKFSMVALCAGIIFAWMRKRFDTLWPCVAAHVALNVALLIVILDKRF